jgi:hypothetical protein
MSTHTSFDIARFTNRNGRPSWRISGWLHGVRIRKNFKSRDEAAVQKSVLEIRAAQVASGLRQAVTLLTDAQLREGEGAFRRLDGYPHSLLFYLDYALANYREPQEQKPLDKAVDEYVATKQKEKERTLLSPQQLRSIKDELRVLQSHFPAGPVAQLTSGNLKT